MRLRELKEKDITHLKKILEQSEMFTFEEVECALELANIFLKDKDQKDYFFTCIADDNDNFIGYACFGPIPLTKGSYDLYWIAVEPKHQRKGIGKILLDDVERILKEKKARILFVETSSQEKYKKTRDFYIKNNYTEAARIIDYYSIGDHMITFQKKL